MATLILFAAGLGAGGVWSRWQNAGVLVLIGEIVVGGWSCLIYGFAKTWQPDWGPEVLIAGIPNAIGIFVWMGASAGLGSWCGTWLWRWMGRASR